MSQTRDRTIKNLLLKTYYSVALICGNAIWCEWFYTTMEVRARGNDRQAITYLDSMTAKRRESH